MNSDGLLPTPASNASSTAANSNVEYFLSADASAIIEHTDKVVYFEDNEMVHIDKRSALQMFTFTSSMITSRAIASNGTIATLDMELEQIMKDCILMSC